MSVVGDLIVGIVTDASQYHKGLDEAEGATKSWGGRIGSVAGTAIKGALAGAAVAAAGAVLSIGAAATDVSLGTQAAAADIAASLGIPTDAARDFAEVARDVYGNNFAGSVQEAGGAVAELAKQLRFAANDPALGSLTEKALSLSDSFGVDVAESVNAAKSLAADMGLSYDEAFDFIAAGFQRGLDSSGDFLDTITEYSTQFAEGGADAGQFFSLLESGLKGGMLGTDKAADAFKEFRLRVLDGSDATSAALAQLGLDAEDMTAGLADGSLSVVDAFGMVTGALGATDDASVRMQAGFALLGSQFEDLGDSAVAGLDLSQTSMGELAGSADSLNAKYETFGDRAAAMWRRVSVAVSPLTDELLRVAEDAMPHVESAIVALTPVIVDLAGQVGPFVGQVGGWISGFQELAPWVQKLILGGGALLGVIGPLLVVLGPVAAGFSAVVGAVAAAGPVIGAVGSAIALLSNPIGWIVLAVGALGLAWSQNWFGIRDVTKGVFERISAVVRVGLDLVRVYLRTAFGYFSEIFQAGLALLRGDWDGALEHLGNAARIGLEGLATLFGTGLGAVIEAVRSMPWGEVGLGILQGMAAGIRNGAGAIVQAAQGAAQAALDAAKTWLGISSPSEVAAEEIGKPFAQGVGAGALAQMERVAGEIGQGLYGMAGGVAGAGAGAGGASVQIVQHFSGSADGPTVRQAAQDGVLAGLRRAGLR